MMNCLCRLSHVWLDSACEGNYLGAFSHRVPGCHPCNSQNFICVLGNDHNYTVRLVSVCDGLELGWEWQTLVPWNWWPF